MCGGFRLLTNKNVRIRDHFFPLLFPKDSENLKSLDIGLREVGAKWRLIGVNKWRRKKSLKKKMPRRFCNLYEQKFSNLRPVLSITFPQEFRKSKKFGHWTLWIWGKKTFKRSEQMKKNCRSDFTPFMGKSFQVWDHFYALLFPKDSENLKSLDIGLYELGAKRRLNGVNNWKKIL